jgi:hypothetical protein
VCLDCGKQFEYDLNGMHMGKAIAPSHDVGIVHPSTPKPKMTKLRYGLLAVVPASIMIRALFRGRKKDKAVVPAKGKGDI